MAQVGPNEVRRERIVKEPLGGGASGLEGPEEGHVFGGATGLRGLHMFPDNYGVYALLRQIFQDDGRMHSRALTVCEAATIVGTE